MDIWSQKLIIEKLISPSRKIRGSKEANFWKPPAKAKMDILRKIEPMDLGG